MVKIELLELTNRFARYKYFPEDSSEYGIVALDRKTGRREFEKVVSGYGLNYAAHAIRRIEEFQKNEEFQERDTVVWY